MQLVTSPWDKAFQGFAHSTRRSLLLVSPFITQGPLDLLVSELRGKEGLRISILTNFQIDSMVHSSLSPQALSSFCHLFPETELIHLPGLHAKVYVSDEELAIVTSANLTQGGLFHNYEYGVQITDKNVVGTIVEDLLEYKTLGAQVSASQLAEIRNAVVEIQERYDSLLRSSESRIQSEYNEKVTLTQERLFLLRAKPGESTNAIFSRTILYVLRHGALSTQEMHPQIQQLHPDLCNDGVDRVIGGIHFGKRWKHLVRDAQQGLQRRGLIALVAGKWTLT